jgi:hypothetical protein
VLRLGLFATTCCALFAGSAEAQNMWPSAAGPPSNPEYGGGISIGSSVDPARVGVRRETWASRRRDRDRADDAAAASPERAREEATELATITVPACQVTDAALKTRPGDRARIYEVACATGPGYLLQADGVALNAQDCVAQWSAIELEREAGRRTDGVMSCNLPSNRNPMGVIADYGRQAGVSCDMDRALAVAENIYEIGCTDRDGWRLEQRAGQWRATACWEFNLRADATCRYSTVEEGRAQWPLLVAGTDASDCIPEAVAWLGDNPQRGAFYEIGCRSGAGLLVQFKDGRTERTFACSDAQRVFNRPCALSGGVAGGA